MPVSFTLLLTFVWFTLLLTFVWFTLILPFVWFTLLLTFVWSDMIVTNGEKKLKMEKGGYSPNGVPRGSAPDQGVSGVKDPPTKNAFYLHENLLLVQLVTIIYNKKIIWKTNKLTKSLNTFTIFIVTWICSPILLVLISYFMCMSVFTS